MFANKNISQLIFHLSASILASYLYYYMYTINTSVDTVACCISVLYQAVNWLAVIKVLEIFKKSLALVDLLGFQSFYRNFSNRICF